MPVRRPPPPAGWTEQAERAHAELLARAEAAGRPPTRRELGERYREAREPLWRAQHRKCAWCEQKAEERFQPVDHYRPCGSARRSAERTDPGYWWLVEAWDNLLFSCAVCNSAEKADWFPLRDLSAALRPGERPPGAEAPLLLDPAGDRHPATVLRFEERAGPQRWVPVGTDEEGVGHATVQLLGLDRRRELRDEHLRGTVRSAAQALREADPPLPRDWARVRELLTAQQPWVLATYDALEAALPAALRAAFPGGWPARTELPLE